MIIVWVLLVWLVLSLPVAVIVGKALKRARLDAEARAEALLAAAKKIDIRSGS